MIMTAMSVREREGDRDEKLWMARGGFGHWQSGLCAQTGRDPGKGANGDAVIPMPRIRVKFEYGNSSELKQNCQKVVLIGNFKRPVLDKRND